MLGVSLYLDSLEEADDGPELVGIPEWDELRFDVACTFYNPNLKENVHLKDLKGPFEIWNRIYSDSGLVEQEYLAAQVVDFATLEAYCKARNRYPLDAHIRHGRFNVNVIALWE